MKIYMVETSGEHTEQCGFSLCESVAKKQAEKLTKRAQKGGWYYNKYWVTEYEVADNKYVKLN